MHARAMRAAGPAFASTGESVSGKCLPSTIWDLQQNDGLGQAPQSRRQVYRTARGAESKEETGDQQRNEGG